MVKRLKDKIAIVTGGTRGIGKAIVKRLASEGAIVYALGRNIQENTEGFTTDTEINANVRLKKVDVQSFESIKECVGEIVNESKRIDILVNNAGITRDNLLIRMSEEEFDSVINTNLKGAFLFAKAVVRTMMGQRSGRIINIGSIVGTIGNPGQANYSSSKSGMVGLTKSLAKELSSRNILVNLIAPGYVRTEMTSKLSEEQTKYFEDNIPLKKIAEPEEIASVVAFFSSEDSRYITGQILHVDGGLAM